MGNIGKGMIAGLAATIVLSALMVMKSQMGLMPELNLPKMIAGMMGNPGQPIIGWVIHFIIGIVLYGVAITIFGDPQDGHSPVGRGLVIAIVGWLVMMIALMPMAGAGLFGMNMGIMAPVMTLVLHLIFGAVLGWTYGRLRSDHRQASAVRQTTRT